MKTFYRFALLVICVTAFISKAFTQADTTKPVKVAIFIPLYVDEALDSLNYSTGKPNIPKTVLPGLEFYNGVVMAIDSLNQEGAKVEISIYDSKQTTETLSDLFRKAEFANIGLVIAAITNTAELKIFSDEALRKNIPLISATYPNDVGVVENPYFILLNSSFQVHLEGLYRHMQKYYSTNTIVAVTKKGVTENYIKNYITQINTSGKSVPLKIKWLSVDENRLSMANLVTSLDSTKSNVFFVASPAESFGLKVVKTLSSTGSYQVTAIGMPTWDGIKDLDKPDCGNVDVVFSTPFLYYSQNPGLSSEINKKYKEKYYSRPSDMVFKGFETTYHFTKLLTKYNTAFINNLSDKSFTLFNQFRIEPVRVRNTSTKPDLLENKKLYFIKKQKGIVKSII